jgi:hypothetical protein
MLPEVPGVISLRRAKQQDRNRSCQPHGPKNQPEKYELLERKGQSL